jgi:iron-sulfur cluster repair protein YtfE (RIC family)
MTRWDPDGSMTVNDVMRWYPQTLSVFDAFGIDACCGGAASLDEAARRDGVALDALLAALGSATLRMEVSR